MIQIGCKWHPRYEAKSKREPKVCFTCRDLWRLRQCLLEQTNANITVYANELRVKT